MTETKAPYRFTHETYQTQAAINLTVTQRQATAITKIIAAMDELELTPNERLMVIAGIMKRLLRPMVEDEAGKAFTGTDSDDTEEENVALDCFVRYPRE